MHNSEYATDKVCVSEQEVSNEKAKEEHTLARCIYHDDTCPYTGVSLYRCNSNTYTGTNADSYTNAYGDANADFYTNADGDANTDFYTYADGDANADFYAYADGDADTHTHTKWAIASTPWVGRQFRYSGKIRNLNHWDHLSCWRYGNQSSRRYFHNWLRVNNGCLESIFNIIPGYRKDIRTWLCSAYSG
jgi:hypothetical protein